VEETPRRVEIPVKYGGEEGPDLGFVAAHNHLSEAEVIRMHASHEYPVYLMGFTPGFPYLGGLDPAIAAPRLSAPRSLVPGGSVGIAGEQTGIYPQDSPGGWRIIGRTRLRLFDLTRDPPFLLAPGDIVVFTPVPALEG
jgi:KipI family sensor histidine kinase inhibitor